MRINKSGLKCGLFTSREVRLNGKISLESCKDAIRTKEKTLISFENQGLFVVEHPQSKASWTNTPHNRLQISLQYHPVEYSQY